MADFWGRAVARQCAALLVLVQGVGCGDEELNADESAELAALEVTGLPDSPTNAFADSPEAAAMGRMLFFDRRLSSDGTVSCGDCHRPELGFSDDRRVSEGVGELEGARHSMPIRTAALQTFLLWDGRADSVWRQPLYALENEREMNFTRTDVALFIASEMRADYEAVFGALPSLEGVAAGVKPGDADWDALPAETRDGVQRVFVNVGKAIEAYERQLLCRDTRFDQWARGEVTFTERELDGATRFVRRGCIGCHSGPALSDGLFHNLGLIRSDDATIDTGREEGLAVLLADELNGAGPYSDDPVAGESRLAEAAAATDNLGAFRTASLRGVTQRPRFGHLGVHTDLEEFIDDTYRRGRGGRGGRGGDGDGDDNDGGNIVGELDPLLDDVDVDGGDAEAIIDFLRTTECVPPAPELLAPK